jgi:hypothetical protein
MTDNAVRPTLRCLRDDLAIPLPPLDVALHEIEHPLIAKSQRIPDEVDAGAAERIVSLNDRVWFKERAARFRGAVTEVVPDEAPLEGWWLGAAGTRTDGDRNDFYEAVHSEAARRGAGTGGPDSTWLLPGVRDARRRELESTTLMVVALRHEVRRLVARSIRSGSGWTLEFSKYRLQIEVRCHGDAYLAIGTEGFIEPATIAVILDSVPGVASDDWQPEPGEVLGISPGPGQIAYSTILPAESQQVVLEEFPDEGGL